jgi:hypothetical protein
MGGGHIPEAGSPGEESGARSEDGRTQPADPLGAMPFAMVDGHLLSP